MKRRNERQKGFTLIELLVVLIVIAVLAAVLVPALTSYLDDAREKKAVSEAQVCVTAATEWAAVQRTALISQAYQTNKSFADAYNAAGNTAKWSNDYAALNTAAPTVTGTPALAEGDGQYFLRPESTPNDTTDETMKNTVKTAAGVDGKLERMQLNADGKVLYLLYTSAEGIPVAYTAAGTAQTPDTTVLVATLPEDTPPKPSEPSHSGDLVFCVKNEYTGEPVPGISFHVVNEAGETVFTSQKTDDKGMVYFDLDPATLTNHFMQFKLVPDDWPDGYQQVFYVKFGISLFKSNGNEYFDSYRIEGIDYNENHEIAKYKKEEVGKLEGGADRHLCTFYVRSVPTLKLRVLDDSTNRHVENVNFTMSREGQSKTIESGMRDTVFYVKLHDGDKLPYGCESIDLRSNDSRGEWSVNCITVPDGYQSFNNFYLKIGLEVLYGHENQLYTDYSSSGNTKIDCNNDYKYNQCIVTIHVQGGKEVNFFVYDGLDSVHKTQLPNAKMELYDKNKTKVATFTTDANGKPTDTESFTKNLSEGDYTLHLESGKPTGYDDPADIPFTIARGTDDLLTIAGTGANASCVDNAESTVTMLVTKPDTKRIQLQVVDAITKKPWAGVNVKVTGGSLNATKKDERNYAIDSLAKNTHTFDWSTLDGGKITVIIAGSDNPGAFEEEHHNKSYTNNFVGSKYEFRLRKNSDGTVTLTETNSREQYNGEISPDGSIVKVYAYPRLLVDFKCTNTSSYSPSPGSAVIKADLQIYNTDEKPASTKDGNTIQEWEVNTDNHNHPVGLSMGNYRLRETGKIGPRFERKNLPLFFTIGQTDKGFPALMDSSGNIVENDDFSNNPLKITALYEYVGILS